MPLTMTLTSKTKISFMENYWGKTAKTVNNNIIMVIDINERMETKFQGMEIWLRQEKEDTTDVNWQRIINLSTDNDLILINTMFKHEVIHKLIR